MGVRKIKKSYISCTGYFASHKNDRQIAFESTLERDVFMILEFDQSVVSYEDQPFTMKYELDGRPTKYTPDILATFQDGTKKVFEVKYQDAITSDNELQKKLATVKEAIEDQYALEFETFTDHDIDQVYLENCKFLYKFAFIQADEKALHQIVDVVQSSPSELSVKEVLANLSTDKNEQLRLLPFIWLTVFQNTSRVNMYEKLTMASRFFKSEQTWER